VTGPAYPVFTQRASGQKPPAASRQLTDLIRDDAEPRP
jgi:hypothetical protein